MNTPNQDKLVRLLNLTGWYFDEQVGGLTDEEKEEQQKLFHELKELLK